MGKILTILNTAFDVSDVKSIPVNKSKSRIDQYINGFNSFFNFDYNKYDNDITFVLTDNTINYSSNINDDILKNIPSNIIFNLKKDNELGAKNKGAGVLTSWLRCEELIKSHDYILHFEPRLLLVSHHLVETFLEEPRNIFTTSPSGRQFNTGLFTCNSKSFLKFIKSITPEHMYKHNLSLESIMYAYFLNNKIGFSKLKEMGVIWHDSHVNKLLKM